MVTNNHVSQCSIMIEISFFLTLHVAGCELLLVPSVDLVCGSAPWVFSFQDLGWKTLCGDQSVLVFMAKVKNQRAGGNSFAPQSCYSELACCQSKSMSKPKVNGLRCITRKYTTACHLAKKYSVCFVLQSNYIHCHLWRRDPEYLIQSPQKVQNKVSW